MGNFNSRVDLLNYFIKVDDFLTNVIQCYSVENENDISSFVVGLFGFFFDNIDIPRLFVCLGFFFTLEIFSLIWKRH